MVRSWFPRLFNLRKPIKMAFLLTDRLRQEKSAYHDRENSYIFAKEKFNCIAKLQYSVANAVLEEEEFFVNVNNVARER